MDINRESIFLKTEKSFFRDTNRSECKTDIDSSTVGKVLGIYVKATDSDGEAENERVKYKSNVIYSICYIDTENNIRKCEMSGSIYGEITGVFASGYLRIDVKTEKAEADVSSLKLVIKTVFTVEAVITEQKKCDYVSGGEGIIVKKQDCEYYKGYGKRKTVFPVEEEFSLDYCIKNVLMHKTVSFITAVQCGVGCIIVDGETHISALLLQNSEKKDIIREEKVIPFRAEIEYDEAMPIMLARADVREKSFKTDISVDEDKNSSLVKVSLSLLFEGEAYSVNDAVISVDAFSLTKELDRNIIVEEKIRPLEQRSFVCEITGKSIDVELPENAELLAVGFENQETSDVRRNGDNLTASGIVGFTAFFRTVDGEVITRKIESDFETTMNVGEDVNAEYVVESKVVSVFAKLALGNTLSVNYTLSFAVFGSETEKVELLTDVIEKGEKTAKNSSISVYLALPNEDLWSLSKRLNTPPEEICEVNKELQFPLTGKERIVIYRQKK